MDFDLMLEPVRVFFVQVVALLPRLLLAVAIVIAGWLLAKAARFAVAKGLRAVNFHILTERAGMDGFLRAGGIRSATPGVVAILIYWLVLLAGLVMAFNFLGLVYITDLLSRVVLFVPRVLVALVIL